MTILKKNLAAVALILMVAFLVFGESSTRVVLSLHVPNVCHIDADNGELDLVNRTDNELKYFQQAVVVLNGTASPFHAPLVAFPTFIDALPRYQVSSVALISSRAPPA
ncbi:hypothetical protein [Geobacter argillaceus]|uniref:hypothetical protein n=1 Tax=Geobacter argillaceus TaxID=345631 RepID=UPI0011A48394|nr:hypothetical protein [Geobacter argillaceus]